MNNEFTTSKKRPTIEDFRDASLEDVIQRMANNPSGLESEDLFISKVIDFKIAENMQETNNKLVKATSDLVKATLFLVIATILVNIIIMCINK